MSVYIGASAPIYTDINYILLPIAENAPSTSLAHAQQTEAATYRPVTQKCFQTAHSAKS